MRIKFEIQFYFQHYFCMFQQGDQGDEGDIGEPGPPGLHVRQQHQNFAGT